uniref:beta-mannosidase n=1 Tax=Clastoptera arizonana TaxID=38151 RepID=A0A1B6DET4_9HEMI
MVGSYWGTIWVGFVVIWKQIYCDKIYLHSDWRVKNGNNSIDVPANVPGGIYTDLRNAGVLAEELFYRFNDQEYRWVAKENWTYYSSFTLREMPKIQNIVLTFDGLDTVTNVSLNGQHIGNTDNMFVRYHFNVKPFLKVGTNNLEIKFTSPIFAASARAQQSKYNIPPKCVPASYNGECHVNHLRKMQASFSWDWGPAFPSVGIWKNVSLDCYDTFIARSMSVQTTLKENSASWSVFVSLYMDVSVKHEVRGMFTTILRINSHKIITTTANTSLITDPNGDAFTHLSFKVKKEDVGMWWPNGMGSQNLYTLKAVFLSEGSSERIELTRKIGFRTVQLVQKYVEPGHPDRGMTFFFKINGVGIFAKGSNYIPTHILPELSGNQTVIRSHLLAAKYANMNMLRVWGGGLYESDFFYETCDEYGILIWQDFMFACNMYPSTKSFLNSVSVEIKQQVRRLQYHPSIAIWAGNNENEIALSGDWYGTVSNFALYKRDYIRLYVDLIKNVVLANDKTRPYVESSPSNGLKSELDGYVSSNPGSTFYGDVHYYNYLNNLWNPQIYPITRFASEYGVQSVPSLETLSSVALISDLYLDSDFMKARQHLASGYFLMTEGMKKNLPMTSSIDLDYFIYLSQINQAVSIKTETESYRRGRSFLASSGEGLTMGALYWQLNDVWQAPSWSSIEFGGKWKMLHYFAKEFFSPILVSPRIEIPNVLRVSVISDLFDNIPVVLNLYVYKWDTMLPQYTETYSFVSYASRVIEAGSWDLAALWAKVPNCGSNENEAKSKCFIYFNLKADNRSNTNLGPDNYIFPTPLHSIVGLRNSIIRLIQITSTTDNQFELTLRTDTIALFVWLDVRNVHGHFSRNGFIMLTPETKVTFYSHDKLDKETVQNNLKIKSLKSNYTLEVELKSVLLL